MACTAVGNDNFLYKQGMRFSNARSEIAVVPQKQRRKGVSLGLLALVLGILQFVGSVRTGTTLRVPHSYPTIQAALLPHHAGDTVLVALVSTLRVSL